MSEVFIGISSRGKQLFCKKSSSVIYKVMDREAHYMAGPSFCTMLTVYKVAFVIFSPRTVKRMESIVFSFLLLF